MKALVFSDLHVGRAGTVNLSDYQWVKNAIASEAPDRVVYAGDVGDFWRCPLNLRDQLVAALKTIMGWAESPIYIVGNHDHVVWTLRGQGWPCEIVEQYELAVAGRRWFIVHGDEADFVIWARVLGLSQEDVEKLYLWVSGHPEVAAGWDAGEAGGTIAIIAKAAVQMGLAEHWSPDLVSLIMVVATRPWELLPSLPSVRTRVATVYRKRVPDLVFGHFHRPRHKRWREWLILRREAADCGSFAERSYVVVDDRGALLGRGYQ